MLSMYSPRNALAGWAINPTAATSAWLTFEGEGALGRLLAFIRTEAPQAIADAEAVARSITLYCTRRRRYWETP